MAKIFNVKDASHTQTERGTTYHLLNEAMGAQRMGVMLIDLAPNLTTPGGTHYHRTRESAYVVIQGSATLLLNGTEHHLQANTVVFLAPGDRHGITRTGTEGFKMIEVYAPLDPDRVDVPDLPP
jgi:mannose-6-phosphate isomerase-like protein (cupin superfamily)